MWPNGYPYYSRKFEIEISISCCWKFKFECDLKAVLPESSGKWVPWKCACLAQDEDENAWDFLNPATKRCWGFSLSETGSKSVSSRLSCLWGLGAGSPSVRISFWKGTEGQMQSMGLPACGASPATPEAEDEAESTWTGRTIVLGASFASLGHSPSFFILLPVLEGRIYQQNSCFLALGQWGAPARD